VTPSEKIVRIVSLVMAISLLVRAVSINGNSISGENVTMKP
jgi:hypothetical protein